MSSTHFSGVSIFGDSSALSEIKPCHMLPLFSFSRAFISSTCSCGIIPLSLNTPVFFCKYSNAVRLPVRLPSVVM